LKAEAEFVPASVGIAFDALFALLRALLMLPARVLGYRGHV
jgi:hypothetical protein